jgi:hypothetical protein
MRMRGMGMNNESSRREEKSPILHNFTTSPQSRIFLPPSPLLLLGPPSANLFGQQPSIHKNILNPLKFTNTILFSFLYISYSFPYFGWFCFLSNLT